MSTGGSGSIHLSRGTPDLAATDVCGGGLECMLAGLMDLSLVAAMIGFLVLLVLASLTYVPTAKELCEEERGRTGAEHVAFDRFVKRTRGLPTANVTAMETAGTGPLLHRETPAGSGGLSTLKDTYRETVMDVPHFEEEYNETLEEHMVAELGPDVAHGVMGESRLTPPIKRGVVEAATDARERRRALLTVLEEEAQSLDRHNDTLASIERSVETTTAPLCADRTYDELVAARNELHRNREQLNDVCRERQHDRRDGQLVSLRLRDEIDLQEFLYSRLEVTYPVIADAMGLLNTVETTLHRIEDELIYRA